VVRSRQGIQAVFLALLGVIGLSTVRADTLISMPPPPSPVITDSVVLAMVARAIESVSSMEAGAEALRRYSTHRQAPYHVYTVEPRRVRSRWWDRYDEYEHDWRLAHGPRIWGTWYPWSGWGTWCGGFTVWSIGYPGEEGMPPCGPGAFTFASLAGGG